MENHICPVCQKKFSKKIYKERQAVYCSQDCAYKGRSLGFTKRNIKKPYNCKRKSNRICLICQNEYIYHKSTQKYCSRKCFEIAHKQNMAGIKNPSYVDGASYLKRGWRGNDWETIRKEIYKRDKYICQDCGVKCQSKRDYADSNKLIQCHHIENYNGKNNNSQNLITLCLKCHIKRHNK
jgi:hypothetical protein